MFLFLQNFIFSVFELFTFRTTPNYNDNDIYQEELDYITIIDPNV